MQSEDIQGHYSSDHLNKQTKKGDERRSAQHSMWKRSEQSVVNQIYTGIHLGLLCWS